MQIMYRSDELQRMSVLDYQSGVSIDRLIENIGAEESKELLINALPIIKARMSSILKALEQNDIGVAARHAHKTSGSIRLYGSSSLEALLTEVMTLAVNQTPRRGLQDELKSEFHTTICEIQERLRVGFS